jgi:hypothetical protein
VGAPRRRQAPVRLRWRRARVGRPAPSSG